MAKTSRPIRDHAHAMSPEAEARLILAEKRTWLAVMRTGIALLALPMSVLGLLVAFSDYYDPSGVVWMLVPVLALCALLISAGVYLVARSFIHLHRDDARLQDLKRRRPEISKLVD